MANRVMYLLRVLSVVSAVTLAASILSAQSQTQKSKQPPKTDEQPAAQNRSADQSGADRSETGCSAGEAKPEITSNLVDGTKTVSGKIGAIIAQQNHTCTAKVEVWL
jgi:hypothetical protein